MRLPRANPSVLVVAFIVLSAGCYRSSIKPGSNLGSELSALTGQDLFRLGVSHAASGDLLRAEQYLSAARQREYQPREVVYWLVRVCIAGSRYRAALNHANDYLRGSPDDWSMRLVASSIHEALGEISSAERELERIVEAEPARPLPHYRLAMLYQRREIDQIRATTHLEAYLRLTPHGPHASEVRAVLAHLGEASTGPRRVVPLGEVEERLAEAP